MQSTLRQNLRFGATGIAHDGISKVLLWLALAGPIEVFIPSSFPLQNSWRLRVFRNDSGTVESATIPGCLARSSSRRRVRGHDVDSVSWEDVSKFQWYLFMVRHVACHPFPWKEESKSYPNCLGKAHLDMIRVESSVAPFEVEPCTVTRPTRFDRRLT